MKQGSARQILQDCNTPEQIQKVFEQHSHESQFITIHSAEGKFVNACSNYLKHTGYSLGQLIGESAYSFFHGDDLSDILKSHAGTTLKPEVSVVNYRLRKNDGSFTPLRTFSKQLPSDSDDGLIITITELND